MWRYFEQQSFYMDEEEFAGHCEAVAILLREWGAVDYFCDYIATIKKRRKLKFRWLNSTSSTLSADTRLTCFYLTCHAFLDVFYSVSSAVVGITINIPIPGVTADSVKFE